jgi:hypothetical protein
MIEPEHAIGIDAKLHIGKTADVVKYAIRNGYVSIRP